MKEVKIIRGPSGSGKSTLIRERFPNATVVSADHFFYRDGIYEFDVTKLPEAHASCFSKFLYALRQSKPLIVVDNTAIRRWEWDNYAQAAELAGYQVNVIEMTVKSIDAVKICARRNTHGVPLLTVAKQVLDFEPCNHFYPVEKVLLTTGEE